MRERFFNYFKRAWSIDVALLIDCVQYEQVEKFTQIPYVQANGCFDKWFYLLDLEITSLYWHLFAVIGKKKK